MPTFHHQDINFNYEIRGSGTDLVMCHGLGGDLNQPMDLVGPVQGCRLIAWDARQHGLTQPSGDESHLRFSTFAADLHALLNKLGVERAVILGISMGAAVAVRFAIAYPQQASALVLHRPAWFTQPSPPNLRLFPIVADLLEQYGADDGLARFRCRPDVCEMMKSHPLTAESLLAQFTKARSFERRARLRSLPADCPVGDPQEVALIRARALVTATDDDPIHPLHIGRQWAQALPGSHFAQIPAKTGDGHKHATAFRAELLQWLRLNRAIANERSAV